MLAKQIEHDFVGDVDIFKHTMYVEHPVLCRREGDRCRRVGGSASEMRASAVRTPGLVAARPRSPKSA
jgi:hypothetical protein